MSNDRKSDTVHNASGWQKDRSGLKAGIGMTGLLRLKYWLPAILILAVLLLTVYWLAARLALADENQRANDRMSLYRSTLVSALEEHQHLPFILAWDPLVVDAVEGADSAQLNQRLDSFAKEAGVDALYLMDPDGLTIAASNWTEDKTFIGNNYGFRPYFKSALSGERGLFFAIGATTLEPGFFVAEPVYGRDGEIAGVIALKVDLTPLTRTWREGGEILLAGDQRGVVVLASNPDWTYRTLAPLSDETRSEIAAARQFPEESLEALDFVSEANGVRIDGTRYLQTVSDVGPLGWSLHYLTPYAQIDARARQAVLLAAAILLLASVAFLLVRTERIRSALFASQADRRSLQSLNRKLADEIEERKRAEQRLERAQSELKQASKMAALGQLSASVTHELGQPIAAMRNYLAAAELPDSGVEGEGKALINQLNAIAARMENITGQLKFFAKAEPKKLVRFDLREVVAGAEQLMVPDFEVRHIRFEKDLEADPVFVFGDSFRIEQVLVNMLRNAMDALSESPDPCINLSLHKSEDSAQICVSDNGPGLSPDALQFAEEPFFTTKASGSGMGLGLSISSAIIKDHGGRMQFSNQADGGAEVTMQLPLAVMDEKAQGDVFA